MTDYKTPDEFDAMLRLLYAYDDLDWREIEGVRQAVVPLYGARPEFIRDDDLVKWHRKHAEFQPAGHVHGWDDLPAVILRHRDDRNGEDEA